MHAFFEADPTQTHTELSAAASLWRRVQRTQLTSQIVSLWVASIPINFTAVVACVLCRASATGDRIGFKGGMYADFFFIVLDRLGLYRECSCSCSCSCRCRCCDFSVKVDVSLKPKFQTDTKRTANTAIIY